MADKKNKVSPQIEYNAFKTPGVNSKLEAPSALTSPAGDSGLPTSLLLSVDKYFAARDPTEANLRQEGPRWNTWKSILGDQEQVCSIAEKLAQSDAPYRALRVLKIARAMGTSISRSKYERVVYYLGGKKEWTLVQEVTNLALIEGKPSARLLDWRALACMEAQDFTGLNVVIDMYGKYGITPRLRSVEQLLRGHLYNHDLDRTKGVLKQMESVGLVADTSTYKLIISGYHRFGLDEIIVGKANEILAKPGADVQSKIVAFNGLIRIFLTDHDLRGALYLIERFANIGNEDEQSRDYIKIDTVTYTILLNYLARHGGLDSLDETLKRIKVVDLRPDAHVAASLIRMYYALGSETLALQVLKDACYPTILDPILLKFLGYNKENAEVSVFRAYRNSPTTEIFNAVVEGALPHHGFRVFKHVLKLMEACNIYPDATTLELFLRNLEREKHILCVDVSRVLNKLISCGIQPTINHLNIILRSIVRNEKIKARSCGWHGLAINVKKTLETLDSGSVDASRKGSPPLKDPELGITARQTRTVMKLLNPIIESLSARSIKADRTTYALRMRFDSFALPPELAAVTAEQTLKHMQKRGLHPNVYHYSALMEAYCSSGKIQAARRLLHEVRARRLLTEPSSPVLMYTILISAHGRQGRPDLAFSVFQEMLDANIAPDIAAVDAVVGAFFAVKAFHLARRVLIDLWPMVAPFPRELQSASLKLCITRLRELRAEMERGGVGLRKRKSGIRLKPGLVSEIIREWQQLMVSKRLKEKHRGVNLLPSTNE